MDTEKGLSKAEIQEDDELTLRPGVRIAFCWSVTRQGPRRDTTAQSSR